MSPATFDLDVLRSFVAGVDLRTFAKAADHVGRSTSAVSAQLKRLEEQVGVPVLRKSGRNLVLTATGEVMLSYARRLLDLNNEASAAVREVDLSGEVRLGLQEDFGEGLLTTVLGGFARAHPQVRVEVTLARNLALLTQVELRRLDLALAWDAGGGSVRAQELGRIPMRWIGQSASSAGPDIVARMISRNEPVPLVALEAPCLMRSAATSALDRAGIPWRLAVTSSSLSGVWSAVEAGLGVTVRTSLGLPTQLSVLSGLPNLPALGLSLHRGATEATPAVCRLADIVLTYLAEVLPDVGHATRLAKTATTANTRKPRRAGPPRLQDGRGGENRR